MRRLCLIITGCLLTVGMLTACGNTEGITETVERSVSEEITSGDEESDEVQESDSGELTDAEGDTEGDTEEHAEEGMEPSEPELLTITIQSKSHYDYSEDDDYQMLFSGGYDLVYLSEAGQAAYPELNKSLQDLNENWEKDYLEDYEKMLQESKGIYEEQKQYYTESGEDFYYSAYQVDEHLEVSRADQWFLSLKNEGFYYYGGAHGGSGLGGYNFDVKTGQQLLLKDVITDIPALQKVVIDELEKHYPEMVTFTSFDEAVPDYLTGEEDQACSWYITPQGIAVYFGEYMLGSYADGTQTVVVSYAEHPELFYEGFHVQEGDYIENYDSLMGIYADVNADGVADSLNIEPQYNEYGDIESIDIKVNDVTTSIDLYGFDITARIAHIKGVSFLYLEVMMENDYRMTYAFKLSEGGAVKLAEYDGYLSGVGPDMDYENNYEADWPTYKNVAITNPEHLYFGKRMQCLSTYEGVAYARINENGELEIPDQYYYANFYGDYGSLTAKQDIQVSKVDMNTLEIVSEDAMISSGSTVAIYGTDGETFVDLWDNQGGLFRVNIESQDWPQTINGTDIEELFDGVMFAG